MKKGIVRFFVVGAVTVAMTVGCSKAGKEEKASSGQVLARVNDKAITMDDFRKEQEKLPPYIKASMETADGKKQFLDNLVTKELVLQQAEKAGMDKDEAVAAKLKEIKQTLIIEALLKKEIEGKFSFTDKDAEEYYNSHKDEFKDEKVKISHIMVKTETEANDILKKLEKKESFEKLAKKYSSGPTASKGGDLGYIGRGTAIPEFEDAAFKLKKAGEISSVVAAGSGYHIIKLLDRKDVEAESFENVKDKIIAMQTKKKQRELFDNFVNSLKKEAKLELNDALLNEEVKKDEKQAEGNSVEGVIEKKEEASVKKEEKK